MIYRLIYTSEATRQLSNEELKEILITSRKNNEPAHITGSLAYVDGIFIQILEGEKDKVKSLADKIKRDGRHASFKVIYESETEDRVFGAWDMSCVRPSAREMADWVKLDGTSKIAEVLLTLESRPDVLPEFVASVVKKTATLPWF